MAYESIKRSYSLRSTVLPERMAEYLEQLQAPCCLNETLSNPHCVNMSRHDALVMN